ncbi:MAG: hypothetical protein K0B02_04480 [DPANN group archaeon]|nr:hypothetical protein [DPANN group archaeon]
MVNKKFIGIEMGVSAFTEFKMKDGSIESTEDGIFLGIVNAKDKDDAYQNIMSLDHNRNRAFDRIYLFEVVDVRY